MTLFFLWFSPASKRGLLLVLVRCVLHAWLASSKTLNQPSSQYYVIKKFIILYIFIYMSIVYPFDSDDVNCSQNQFFSDFSIFFVCPFTSLESACAHWTTPVLELVHCERKRKKGKVAFFSAPKEKAITRDKEFFQSKEDKTGDYLIKKRAVEAWKRKKNRANQLLPFGKSLMVRSITPFNHQFLFFFSYVYVKVPFFLLLFYWFLVGWGRPMWVFWCRMFDRLLILIFQFRIIMGCVSFRGFFLIFFK